MQIVDVVRGVAPVMPLHRLREAIDSVGKPDFERVVMRLFGDAVQADVWSLVRLEAGAPEAVEIAMGREGEGPWRASGLQFVRLYGPFDPMRPLAAALPEDAWQVGLIESHDIKHPAYRDCCYDAYGIRRRLSTRVHCRSGDFQVNAYGFAGGGLSFDARAVVGFVEVTKFLVACVDRHLREREPVRAALSCAWTPQDVERRLLAFERRLSRREIDVLALAVCGSSVAETAVVLGLQETSVSTYRRRGLAKLDVANATQLLQKLLRLSTAGHLRA